MRFLGICLLFASGAAFAGEYAVLTTGSRMRVDRHETDGATVRLYNGSGYIELNKSAIQGFEPEEPRGAVRAAAKATKGKAVAAATPHALADAAADKYGLPRKLVRSVMSAESGYQPGAVSPKGAVGLMQLMPDTARMLGADPNDPAQNVDAGTRYLRELLLRYNGVLWDALAAYNAGPGAVDKYGTVPPYAETRRYVKKISRDFEKAGDQQAANGR